MNITFPAAFVDGNTLAAADLNALVTAITGYTVALSDLANQYAPFTVTLCTDSLASGATHTHRIVVPAGETWVPDQAEVYYQTGVTPTVSLQFTDDGANVLNSPATATSAGGTPSVQTSMAISSIAAGSSLIFTLTGSGGATATNVTGVVHFKCKLLA